MNTTAYLVVCLVPPPSNIHGAAMVRGFDIFSEAEPTVMGDAATAVIHQETGKDYEEARRLVVEYAAKRWPWIMLTLRLT